MSNFYIGQLMCVAFDYAPKYWADCNGQLLAINTNQALFSLLGTTFGGNGVSTFGLPNLQGRCIVGAGPQTPLGQSAGEPAHTLLTQEMPTHNHPVNTVSSTGTLAPVNNEVAGAPMYNNGAANNIMNPNAIGMAGNSQPHENRSPFTTLRWVIATQGIFPSRP